MIDCYSKKKKKNCYIFQYFVYIECTNVSIGFFLDFYAKSLHNSVGNFTVLFYHHHISTNAAPPPLCWVLFASKKACSSMSLRRGAVFLGTLRALLRNGFYKEDLEKFLVFSQVFLLHCDT